MPRSAQLSTHLHGGRRELFAVLTDVDAYREWLPGVEHSQILAREGDIVVAELACPRYTPRVFTLEFLQTAPSSVVFQQIDSYGQPEVSGRWDLEEPEAGGSQVLVRASLCLAAPFWRLGVRRRIRSVLSAALSALDERCRHLGSEVAAEEGAKQKVLEVVREAAGLRIWYLGETFFLQKAEEPRGR